MEFPCTGSPLQCTRTQLKLRRMRHLRILSIYVDTCPKKFLIWISLAFYRRKCYRELPFLKKKTNHLASKHLNNMLRLRCVAIMLYFTKVKIIYISKKISSFEK